MAWSNQEQCEEACIAGQKTRLTYAQAHTLLAWIMVENEKRALEEEREKRSKKPDFIQLYWDMAEAMRWALSVIEVMWEEESAYDSQ